MPFNIQNIVSELTKSGTAKTSHFEVQITGVDGDERAMIHRCDTAELPGRTITTAETRFGNYGPVAKVAYNQVYTDVTMSFLLSEDMREKEYFEKWHQAILGTGAFEGGSTSSDFNGFGGMTKFAVGYYDDYVGTVEIRQFGEGGDLRSIHTLNQAYPMILGGVAMNWADESVAKLTVTFAYRNYKCVFKKQDQPGLGSGFSLRLDKTGISASFRNSLGNIGFDSAIGTSANIDLGRVGKIAKSANLI